MILKKFILLINLMLVIFSCQQKEVLQKVNLHIAQQHLLEKDQQLLVINFLQPDYLQKEGLRIAEKAQQVLLASGKFSVVALQPDFDWSRSGKNFEEKLSSAFNRFSKFDYLLIGEIKNFYYGQLTPTRIEIVVRLIRTRDRLTIFYASAADEEPPAENTAPLNVQLSQAASPPLKLAEKLLGDILGRL